MHLNCFLKEPCSQTFQPLTNGQETAHLLIYAARLGFTKHRKDLSWKNGMHTEDSLMFTHIRRKALMSLSSYEVKFW